MMIRDRALTLRVTPHRQNKVQLGKSIPRN